jgi:hypothetical protein
MASKNPCGHPADWVLTLNAGGKRFTYCIGCMVEKIGLRHLQTYDNPYVKLSDSVIEKKVKAVKEANPKL